MNLDQVARRANVSTATVSRVLNNSTSVRSATRERVLEAIAALNYHPNLHARDLAGRKSRTIGVIVSNLENPFFFDIYKEVEAGAHRRGYEVVMANTNYSADQLLASLRLMIGRRVAGLAAIVSEISTEAIDELHTRHVPTVFYDVGTPRPHITNIRVNYRLGIEQLIGHLSSLGHRKLGFIGHHSALGPINERRKALSDAVAANPALELHTAADADTLEGGRAAARELLDSDFQPTAILCVNDIMAAGALRELRDRNLRVPEDISITGFDNIALSEFCVPSLTTVHIPRDRIGQIICDRLIEPEASSDHEIVIDPEFVVRSSTGPVR